MYKSFDKRWQSSFCRSITCNTIYQRNTWIGHWFIAINLTKTMLTYLNTYEFSRSTWKVSKYINFKIKILTFLTLNDPDRFFLQYLLTRNPTTKKMMAATITTATTIPIFTPSSSSCQINSNHLTNIHQCIIVIAEVTTINKSRNLKLGQLSEEKKTNDCVSLHFTQILK